MYFLFELAIVISLFAYGCWTMRAASIFLPTIAAALASFAIFVGNPIGLLTSIGGWIILDLTMATAAIIAHVAGQFTQSRHVAKHKHFGVSPR